MWNTLALLLVGSGLSLTAAGDAGKTDVAREVDLKGYRSDRPAEGTPKPTRITTAEELAKAVPDKEWRDRIARQVDFAREQLLFVAWSGSGGDKLSFRVEAGKKGPVVVFGHTR